MARNPTNNDQFIRPPARLAIRPVYSVGRHEALAVLPKDWDRQA